MISGGLEPEEGLDPEEQSVAPRRRVAQTEEASGPVDNRENGQLEFIESGEGADEPDDVIVTFLPLVRLQRPRNRSFAPCGTKLLSCRAAPQLDRTAKGSAAPAKARAAKNAT